jgi:hypothetical protein
MGIWDLFFGNKNVVEYTGTEEQRLLGMGAILIYNNNFYTERWYPTTLELNELKKVNSREVAQGILADFWAAECKEDVVEITEALLSLGGKGLMGGDESESREEINARMRGGKLTPEEVEMFSQVRNYVNGCKFDKVKLTHADFDSVDTTLAWDLERASYLARLAFTCGWFTREETLALLRKTYRLAQENFSCWRDYAISFIKGRSIVMCRSRYGDMTDLWANASLLTEPKWGTVWTWAPLH